MPNYCNYELHAYGKKKDIQTLYDWLRADYYYRDDGTIIEVTEEDGTKRPVEHHIGYRVFEANTTFFEDEDVKKILEYAKGTQYENALILATFGLRRSEICALTLNDLNGAFLTINKAKVLDESRNWIIKSTKTTESARKITLSDKAVIRINELGMYNGCPDSINEFLTNALIFLDIPHFTLHKFRHYFATKMSAILPEADVLKLGGWSKSNNSVMKTVYRHSEIARNKEMQKKVADSMNDLF